MSRGTFTGGVKPGQNFLANLPRVTSPSSSTTTSARSADPTTTTAAAAAADLIAFYSPLSSATDSAGRTLSQILQWSDQKLEAQHDYIQWLFPLPESSPFNFRAPVVDQFTAETFRSRPDLRQRLSQSFNRMLEFYGFCRIDNSKTTAAAAVVAVVAVVPDTKFEQKSRFWARHFNHNHLRITRIIRSLRVLGLEPEAAAFYNALLEAVGGVNGKRVSATSLAFWKRAARRPLEIAPEDDVVGGDGDEDEDGERL